MSKTKSIVRLSVLTTIFAVAMLLLFCESDSLFWLLAGKAAGIAMIYGGGKLSNRWEDSLPTIDEGAEL